MRCGAPQRAAHESCVDVGTAARRASLVGSWASASAAARSTASRPRTAGRRHMGAREATRRPGRLNSACLGRRASAGSERRLAGGGPEGVGVECTLCSAIRGARVLLRFLRDLTGPAGARVHLARPRIPTEGAQHECRRTVATGCRRRKSGRDRKAREPAGAQRRRARAPRRSRHVRDGRSRSSGRDGVPGRRRRPGPARDIPDATCLTRATKCRWNRSGRSRSSSPPRPSLANACAAPWSPKGARSASPPTSMLRWSA